MELKEVKKNQTGSGLLIENDGFVVIDKHFNNRLYEDISVSRDEKKIFDIPYPFVLDAVFQKYGIKNANGRIYPERILKKAVDEYMIRIRDRRALGALNHPDSSLIDGKEVAHNIIELHWEGQTLVGKLELHLSPGYVKYGIISTVGDMTANLVLSGYKVGVSSRGVGSVEQDSFGNLLVGDDFEIVCWDIVLDPSTPNAYFFNSEEEKNMYVEMDNRNMGKSKINEKLDKLEKMLLL